MTLLAFLSCHKQEKDGMGLGFLTASVLNNVLSHGLQRVFFEMESFLSCCYHRFFWGGKGHFCLVIVMLLSLTF